jgi:hypothetical protein
MIEAANETGASRRRAMPAGVKLSIALVTGAVLLGAIYLIAVRGSALLLDFAAAVAAYCF